MLIVDDGTVALIDGHLPAAVLLDACLPRQ
ncbi:MAG: hypothetical protein ACJAVI_003955 [Candidatus Azotimanducaceae bacterium]|jgi:hypothetical protein